MTTIKTKKSFLNYSHTIGICVMDGRGFMFPVDTAIGKNGRLHTVSRAYTPAVFQLRITMYDINSNFYGVYGGYTDYVYIFFFDRDTKKICHLTKVWNDQWDANYTPPEQLINVDGA